VRATILTFMEPVIPSTCAPGNHSTNAWIFKLLLVKSARISKNLTIIPGIFVSFVKSMMNYDFAALFVLGSMYFFTVCLFVKLY